MKRFVLYFALPASLSTLLACGYSTTVSGSEESGLVSSLSKIDLGGAAPSVGSLSNLQLFLFGDDVSGPSALEPIDCTDGGSVTRTFDVDEAPLDTISSGDVVRVVFESCADGDRTYQGTLVYTFAAVSGDPATDDVWSLSATVVAEDFVRATADSQRLSNGTLSLDAMANGGDLSIELTGSYTSSVSNARGTFERELDDITLSWDYTAASDTVSIVVEGKYRTDALSGVFILETVEPLVGAPGEIPESGELRITGEGDASLSLVIEPGEIVRLRLDEDGDGVIDDVESVSWNEL